MNFPQLPPLPDCGSLAFSWSGREQGHDARLIPAPYVKPYVMTNKNDYIDAEAIAEAVTRLSISYRLATCDCCRRY